MDTYDQNKDNPDKLIQSMLILTKTSSGFFKDATKETEPEPPEDSPRLSSDLGSERETQEADNSQPQTGNATD